MDRLQGYNTDGHEYRISEIDRNKTKRLKWMMSEAKKNVENAEANENNGLQSNLNDKNQKLQPTPFFKKTNDVDFKKGMFDPSTVNKFVSFRNDSFK